MPIIKNLYAAIMSRIILINNVLKRSFFGKFLTNTINEFLKFKYHLNVDIFMEAAPIWNTFESEIKNVL